MNWVAYCFLNKIKCECVLEEPEPVVMQNMGSENSPMTFVWRFEEKIRCLMLDSSAIVSKSFMSGFFHY